MTSTNDLATTFRRGFTVIARMLAYAYNQVLREIATAHLAALLALAHPHTWLCEPLTAEQTRPWVRVSVMRSRTLTDRLTAAPTRGPCTHGRVLSALTQDRWMEPAT